MADLLQVYGRNKLRQSRWPKVIDKEGEISGADKYITTLGGSGRITING